MFGQAETKLMVQAMSDKNEVMEADGLVYKV